MKSYKWGTYFGKKSIKVILLFYFALMISLGIILPIVMRKEFNAINKNFLDEGNTPLIFLIITLSEIVIYSAIKRSKQIAGLIKSKKINFILEKGNRQINAIRWILLYIHLAFAPIMAMIVSWHAITSLQFVIQYNAFEKFVNISGLLLWMSTILMLITGTLMATAYGWSRKYKILWIHIFSAFLLLIGLTLHLISMN